MIFRRSPASSSFVLAAARLRALQLDPGRAARRPGHLRGRSRRTVSPARTAGRSHRARSVRPLDSGGPYGCRDEGRPHATAACWALAIQERDQGPRSAEPRDGLAIRDTQDAGRLDGASRHRDYPVMRHRASAASLGECAGGLAGLPRAAKIVGFAGGVCCSLGGCALCHWIPLTAAPCGHATTSTWRHRRRTTRTSRLCHCQCHCQPSGSG